MGVNYLGAVYRVKQFGQESGILSGYGFCAVEGSRLETLALEVEDDRLHLFKSIAELAKYINMEGCGFWYKNFDKQVTVRTKDLVFLKTGLSDDQLELLAMELSKALVLGKGKKA